MSNKVKEVEIANEYVISLCDKISAHPTLEWRKNPPGEQHAAIKNSCFLVL